MWLTKSTSDRRLGWSYWTESLGWTANHQEPQGVDRRWKLIQACLQMLRIMARLLSNRSDYVCGHIQCRKWRRQLPGEISSWNIPFRCSVHVVRCNDILFLQIIIIIIVFVIIILFLCLRLPTMSAKALFLGGPVRSFFQSDIFTTISQ